MIWYREADYDRRPLDPGLLPERADHLKQRPLEERSQPFDLAQPRVDSAGQDVAQPVAAHADGGSNVLGVAPAEEVFGPATAQFLQAAARRVSRETWLALRGEEGEASLAEPGLPEFLRSARFRPSPAEMLPPSLVGRLAGVDLCNSCARRRRDLFEGLLREIRATGAGAVGSGPAPGREGEVS